METRGGRLGLIEQYIHGMTGLFKTFYVRLTGMPDEKKKNSSMLGYPTQNETRANPPPPSGAVGAPLGGTEYSHCTNIGAQ